MEIESMYNKIDDLEENDNGTLEGSAAADTAAMIKFIEQIAAEKEKDLECPVGDDQLSKILVLYSNLFFSDLPRDCNRANFQLLGKPCDLLPMQTKVKHFVFTIPSHLVFLSSSICHLAHEFILGCRGALSAECSTRACHAGTGQTQDTY